jgi:septal ring factor EnvC (AmiA/AmiB activator)
MTSEIKILQPISTIKMIRELTNCGLKDGNDLVFALRDGDIPAYTKALEKIRAEMYGPDRAELETKVDSLQQNLNEANVEATARERYIKDLEETKSRLTRDLGNFERENAELRDNARYQSPVKAPLIDRELAKSLILHIHEGRVTQALALILEAALPREEESPIRSCSNCDPGSNEEACNSCHNFSNWREDTCPF